jgi:hypothetical protein
VGKQAVFAQCCGVIICASSALWQARNTDHFERERAASPGKLDITDPPTWCTICTMPIIDHSDRETGNLISNAEKIALAVLFGCFTLMTLVFALLGPEDSAQWGDMISGFLGVGVAGAGTVLFYSTVVLQRRALIVQQEELRAALSVAKEQAGTAVIQAGHSMKQVEIARVESSRRTLGQLLELRNQIIFSYSQKSAQQEIEERHVRLFRHSQLVLHHIEQAEMSAPEKTKWMTVFGPWEEFTWGEEQVQIMTPPYKHDFCIQGQDPRLLVL